MTPDVDPAIRQQLFDLVVRYATGIDQRDWQLFRTCWTDDAVSDYGDVGKWDSGEAITGFMAKIHESCGHTAHRMGWPEGLHAPRAAERLCAIRPRSRVSIVRHGQFLESWRAQSREDAEKVAFEEVEEWANCGSMDGSRS